MYVIFSLDHTKEFEDKNEKCSAMLLNWNLVETDRYADKQSILGYLRNPDISGFGVCAHGNKVSFSAYPGALEESVLRKASFVSPYEISSALQYGLSDVVMNTCFSSFYNRFLNAFLRGNFNGVFVGHQYTYWPIPFFGNHHHWTYV